MNPSRDKTHQEGFVLLRNLFVNLSICLSVCFIILLLLLLRKSYVRSLLQ